MTKIGAGCTFITTADQLTSEYAVFNPQNFLKSRKILVGEDPDQLLHPGVIVGYFLICLGSIGVFFGRLIRSAFSRQREYLADASAVQFTRNPFAMASALNVIREHAHDPALHGVHADELAHVCFQSGKHTKFLKGLLASHPQLQKRIDAIDPNFAIKNRIVERRRENDSESTSKSSDFSFFLPAMTTCVEGGRALSDAAIIVLTDARNSIASLFALFVCGDVNKQSDFYSGVESAFDNNFCRAY